MWFIGVEVGKGTSAPPPKKNPGSAPAEAFCVGLNLIPEDSNHYSQMLPFI